MGDKREINRDGDGTLNERIFEHGTIIGESNTRFTIEPSNEKDYDISLMTGKNTGKDSEGK